MEPLVCPQCGGQITNYSPGQTYVTCGYCSTKFLIDQDTKVEQPKPTPFVNKYNPDAPLFEDIAPQISTPKIVSAGVASVLIAIGIAIFFSVAAIRNTSRSSKPLYDGSNSRDVPTRAKELNLLQFGGKGSSDGKFQDANSIAVDRSGRIYVSDDSLRVQRFDVNGTFVASLQIPAKGANYEHARTIDKIAVADNGNLYVAVGGVVLVYSENGNKPLRTLQVAPDYIQDFALRKDGSILLVSSDGRIETLIVANPAGKIMRQIKGFHTKPADVQMSPPEVGVGSIRIAVDDKRNIYSIYALGDLGSYMLSYDASEFKILAFTPEGKYVYKFAQSFNSCGIAVDNQNRFYVSNSIGIDLYHDDGTKLSSISDIGTPRAFALDADNNVYILSDDKVIKRMAVR